MWYIFKDSVCISSCNFQVDSEDLSSRCEICVESNDPTILALDISKIILSDGKPQKVEDSFDDVKTVKKLAINAKRNELEQSGFTYMDKTIQSDPVSVQRITIAVQSAQVAISTSSDFSLEWMCADNTTLTLTADQTVAMAVFLASFGQTLHNTATKLKEQVDACTTIAEVEAIPISF